MTEHTTKDRNAASGFDDYIEPLLERLRSAGYAECTLIKKRTVARAFGRWSKSKLITPAELKGTSLNGQFIQHADITAVRGGNANKAGNIPAQI